MNKDKQIEEMAKTLCEDYGKCQKCTLSNPECENPCMIKEDCERLYNQGYRKASEIIDEFAVGLKDFLHDAPVVYQAWFGAKIDNFADRLKKKYT